MGSDAAFGSFPPPPSLPDDGQQPRPVAVPVTPNQLAHSLSVSASVILSVDPSYPARVAPRRGARAGDADGRPCLMVNPRDKEEPTTTISQPWGTNERAAWRGERDHGAAVVPDTQAPASHTINGAFRSYEPKIYHVSPSPQYFLATFSSPSPAILLLSLPTSPLRSASARN